MSVFKRGEIFHYDFWFQNRRYVGTTRQLVRRDAILCEQDVKRRVRRQSAGLEAPPAVEAPRFQDWAEVHFSERRPQMTRPEFLEDNPPSDPAVLGCAAQERCPSRRSVP